MQESESTTVAPALVRSMNFRWFSDTLSSRKTYLKA